MTRETHALVSPYFRRKHSDTFKPFPNTPPEPNSSSSWGNGMIRAINRPASPPPKKISRLSGDKMSSTSFSFCGQWFARDK
ncbi:MAG: hypothetical protein ACYCXP_10700 [Leptospirillum sp.]